MADKDFKYLEAYFSAEMEDDSGVTIMINKKTDKRVEFILEKGFKMADKDFKYLEAYFSAEMEDDSGVTIMINKKTDSGDTLDGEEECFEGGNSFLSGEICEQFNCLNTKEIENFYIIRDAVFKKHNYQLKLH